jgi:uncharacterized protein YutE (UPF0331/DUF86 family)
MRIEAYFDNAKQYIEMLQSISSIPLEEFLEELPKRLESERLFEIITQAMLDVCTHIVSNSPLPAPASYAECLLTLAQMGVYPLETGKKYAQIIRMRNIITHQYRTIDYILLFQAFEPLLHDFKAFQASIIDWLESQTS